ncbi:golgin subfamily B member 1-like isoform X2 [Denticeps clupeoides]|nr:golgin subfamily B member 1-like isoform X2 [Denticeps clupeoides]
MLKTSDPTRDGILEVKTIGEKIVLYVLNRIIYRGQDMTKDDVPFLRHGEDNVTKILWKNGEAIGFYSIKDEGIQCMEFLTERYQLPVMDSMFVRKDHRRQGHGLRMLEDFVESFQKDSLGLRYPVSCAMLRVCSRYLRSKPQHQDLLWEVQHAGMPHQRTHIAKKIRLMDSNVFELSNNHAKLRKRLTEEQEVEEVFEISTDIHMTGEVEDALGLTQNQSSNLECSKLIEDTEEATGESYSENGIRVEEIEAGVDHPLHEPMDQTPETDVDKYSIEEKISECGLLRRSNIHVEHMIETTDISNTVDPILHGRETDYSMTETLQIEHNKGDSEEFTSSAQEIAGTEPATLTPSERKQIEVRRGQCTASMEAMQWEDRGVENNELLILQEASTSTGVADMDALSHQPMVEVENVKMTSEIIKEAELHKTTGLEEEVAITVDIEEATEEEHLQLGVHLGVQMDGSEKGTSKETQVQPDMEQERAQRSRTRARAALDESSATASDDQQLEVKESSVVEHESQKSYKALRSRTKVTNTPTSKSSQKSKRDEEHGKIEPVQITSKDETHQKAEEACVTAQTETMEDTNTAEKEVQQNVQELQGNVDQPGEQESANTGIEKEVCEMQRGEQGGVENHKALTLQEASTSTGAVDMTQPVVDIEVVEIDEEVKSVNISDVEEELTRTTDYEETIDKASNEIEMEPIQLGVNETEMETSKDEESQLSIEQENEAKDTEKSVVVEKGALRSRMGETVALVQEKTQQISKQQLQVVSLATTEELQNEAKETSTIELEQQTSDRVLRSRPKASTSSGYNTRVEKNVNGNEQSSLEVENIGEKVTYPGESVQVPALEKEKTEPEHAADTGESEEVHKPIEETVQQTDTQGEEASAVDMVEETTEQATIVVAGEPEKKQTIEKRAQKRRRERFVTPPKNSPSRGDVKEVLDDPEMQTRVLRSGTKVIKPSGPQSSQKSVVSNLSKKLANEESEQDIRMLVEAEEIGDSGNQQLEERLEHEVEDCTEKDKETEDEAHITEQGACVDTTNEKLVEETEVTNERIMIEMTSDIELKNKSENPAGKDLVEEEINENEVIQTVDKEYISPKEADVKMDSILPDEVSTDDIRTTPFERLPRASVLLVDFNKALHQMESVARDAEMTSESDEKIESGLENPLGPQDAEEVCMEKKVTLEQNVGSEGTQGTPKEQVHLEERKQEVAVKQHEAETAPDQIETTMSSGEEKIPAVNYCSQRKSEKPSNQHEVAMYQEQAEEELDTGMEMEVAVNEDETKTPVTQKENENTMVQVVSENVEITEKTMDCEEGILENTDNLERVFSSSTEGKEFETNKENLEEKEQNENTEVVDKDDKEGERGEEMASTSYEDKDEQLEGTTATIAEDTVNISQKNSDEVKGTMVVKRGLRSNSKQAHVPRRKSKRLYQEQKGTEEKSSQAEEDERGNLDGEQVEENADILVNKKTEKAPDEITEKTGDEEECGPGEKTYPGPYVDPTEEIVVEREKLAEQGGLVCGGVLTSDKTTEEMNINQAEDKVAFPGEGKATEAKSSGDKEVGDSGQDQEDVNDEGTTVNISASEAEDRHECLSGDNTEETLESLEKVEGSEVYEEEVETKQAANQAEHHKDDQAEMALDISTEPEVMEGISEEAEKTVLSPSPMAAESPTRSSKRAEKKEAGVNGELQEAEKRSGNSRAKKRQMGYDTPSRRSKRIRKQIIS